MKLHSINDNLHLNVTFLQGTQCSILIISILFQTHINEGGNIAILLKYI